MKVRQSRCIIGVAGHQARSQKCRIVDDAFVKDILTLQWEALCIS